MLCGGVDLPIEAGTCGRWVSRGRDRCYACYQRRRWLLDHALNPAEMTVSALLESAAGSAAEAGADPHEDATPPEDTGRAVPLLDDLSALGDPCLRW